MRLVVIIAALVGLTVPAVACPPLEACVVRLRSTVKDPTKPSSHLTLAIRQPRAPKPSPLTLAIRQPTAPKRAPGEVVIPWFWKSMHQRFYGHMPRYERPKEFTIVFSPVIVSSLTDTVPGVGISGKF